MLTFRYSRLKIVRKRSKQRGIGEYALFGKLLTETSVKRR